MSTIRVFLIAGLAIAPLGCALSNSSDSISTSISSPFESSSGSSDAVAYREDVREATYAYVRSGGELPAYQRRVGDLAEQRGITNWEEDEFTCASIGEGLRKAELQQAEARAFAARLFGADALQIEYVQLGYTTVR